MADSKKNMRHGKQSKTVLIAGFAAIAVIALFFVLKGGFGGKNAASSSGGNLIIPKSEISETAKFYPYSAGGTKMEVLAVKAPDGTIRTAFNTCQVCYNSGRGYYKQEKDELVCQNCGNRFKISQVEKIKGGCNPVPVLEENKSDDGTNIIIPKDFLDKNKALFGNWKK